MGKDKVAPAHARLPQMLDKLKDQAFRLTPQRLATSADHPSVSQIHAAVQERFPTTSLATVCKTVLLLKELNAETGYRIQHHRMDFFGLCPERHKEIIYLF